VARKFLYAVAILITLAIIVMIAFSFFGAKLMQNALVPHVAFTTPAPLPQGFYDGAAGWIGRPDGRTGDVTSWQPPSLPALPNARDREGAAIFFIHPTSAFETLHWNGKVDDPVAGAAAERFLRMQVTALAPAGRVWAPRYRQAVFGAFLTDKPDAKKALDLAFGDVRLAFETFLRANPTGPIILAAHSQGSLHLLNLLAQRTGGVDWRPRVVAIYAVGWPISIEHDLPALGFPACAAARQTGCILSWQSFAQPADTSAVDAVFDGANGFDGQPRKGSAMLCTNPLTGGAGSQGSAAANRGVLMGDGNVGSTQLMPPGGIGARCAGRGFLMLDSAPKLGAAVLPGNNYHVYDYALFWGNVRADALERLAAWQTTH
jgi:hypothetical protein